MRTGRWLKMGNYTNRKEAASGKLAANKNQMHGHYSQEKNKILLDYFVMPVALLFVRRIAK